LDNAFNKETPQILTSIIHSLNEPFSVISNYVHGSIKRIQSRSSEIHQLLSVFEKIALQLERASKIILRMKHFQNKNSFGKKKHDIHQVIEETIYLVKDEMNGLSINLLYRHPHQSVYVNIHQELIQQAFLNLIRNSIEALRDYHTFNPHIIIEVNQSSEHLAEVLIIDNGPGVPKEMLHKVFDAYYTNKPYGMGLGLAFSRNIIDDHGGSLTHENYPVPGTCFKLTLPIYTAND
jgi:two-component system sensor kinase FixL